MPLYPCAPDAEAAVDPFSDVQWESQPSLREAQIMALAESLTSIATNGQRKSSAEVSTLTEPLRCSNLGIIEEQLPTPSDLPNIQLADITYIAEYAIIHLSKNTQAIRDILKQADPIQHLINIQNRKLEHADTNYCNTEEEAYHLRVFAIAILSHIEFDERLQEIHTTLDLSSISDFVETLTAIKTSDEPSYITNSHQSTLYQLTQQLLAARLEQENISDDQKLAVYDKLLTLAVISEEEYYEYAMQYLPIDFEGRTIENLSSEEYAELTQLLANHLTDPEVIKILAIGYEDLAEEVQKGTMADIIANNHYPNNRRKATKLAQIISYFRKIGAEISTKANDQTAIAYALFTTEPLARMVQASGSLYTPADYNQIAAMIKLSGSDEVGPIGQLRADALVQAVQSHIMLHKQTVKNDATVKVACDMGLTETLNIQLGNIINANLTKHHKDQCIADLIARLKNNLIYMTSRTDKATIQAFIDKNHS